MRQGRSRISSGVGGALLCLLAGCGSRGEDGAAERVRSPRIAEGARALIESAPLIVTAEVADVATGRTTEGLAFEDVRLAIARTLKGPIRETVTIEQANPGGRVLGAPSFATGEKYLLLLRPSRTEAERHVPVPQGIYVLRNGRAEAMQPGPVADAWDGALVDDLLAEIGSIVNASSRNPPP
ncbi:MAG: hypothetical protein ACR2GQ_09220 [Gemmatimonadota bacterium]|jgi:hypothetical protein